MFALVASNASARATPARMSSRASVTARAVRAVTTPRDARAVALRARRCAPVTRATATPRASVVAAAAAVEVRVKSRDAVEGKFVCALDGARGRCARRGAG